PDRDSTAMEASLWVYVDTEMPGLPFWQVKQLDADGQLIDARRVWTMRSRDTQRGWLRVSIPFELNAATRRLELWSEYQFDCWMDELLIREKTQEVFHESEENPSFFSYNNYLISKE
ncbi:MAG: hypothetical protein AAFO94_04795, partial [Bacteroidota bacterium]